jgi:hypothetical protein
MADKNLPIKFFQKRQKDELGTEGRGDSSIPAWVNPEFVGRKSLYFREVLKGVSKILSEKVTHENYLPSVVKVKVSEDALAKMYRREIGNLFNVRKLNIIGVNGEDEVLVKIDNEGDLQAMIKNLSRSDYAFPSSSIIIGISAISDIELFKPIVDVKDSLPDETILKVKLFNYGDDDLNEILIRAFEKHCLDNKIGFKRTAYSGDLNIYKVTGVTADALEEFSEFEGVQLVTEMPSYTLDLDEIIEEQTIPVKSPKEGVIYPVVGLLDSGIEKTAHLSPWIVEQNITFYPPEYVNKAHGTFVAGILLYGDELEGQKYTGFEGCKLFEAIVVPDLAKQKVSESDLIEQIRDAVSRNDQIKVWNLSLGSTIEADLYEFSDFAKALDEIQEQHDVLIVKSAGNCRNFETGAPKSRITRSADTIRGIVVGSIAHGKNATDIADKNNPSPFSRIGPGPSHLVKPDLVHIGGNAGLDNRNKTVINPVKSFSLDGKIAKRVGTSFATPRIAAIASGLNGLLNETFNPILIKSLIIHSAKYPAEMKMDIAKKIDEAGFGLPASINEIIFNEPNEITLVLQDTIEKGSFIDILDFPFPQSMVDENGYFYGEITVTLVTAPVLEVSQGAEYCQSNIEVMLGTYDEKVERDMTKRGTKNPIGAEGRQNILTESIYSRVTSRNKDSQFATERVLVSYGDKFQPVKKWCVNLDELTDGNKEKYLKPPKSWYLKLEGLFRHFTESKCEAQKIVPRQEFCLLVTIRDTKKRGNIYTEVTQLLDNFSFVHSNIKIKEEVRLRLNG